MSLCQRRTYTCCLIKNYKQQRIRNRVHSDTLHCRAQSASRVACTRTAYRLLVLSEFGIRTPLPNSDILLISAIFPPQLPRRRTLQSPRRPCLFFYTQSLLKHAAAPYTPTLLSSLYLAPFPFASYFSFFFIFSFLHCFIVSFLTCVASRSTSPRPAEEFIFSSKLTHRQ